MVGVVWVVALGCGGSSSAGDPGPIDGGADPGADSSMVGDMGLADGDVAGADATGDGGTDAAGGDGSTTTRPCVTGRDCTGATPACDTAAKKCVGCRTDADCGALRCDSATGQCRDCVTDAHCAAPAPFCDYKGTEQCTAKCKTDADCPTGPSHCEATLGVCVDCFKGTHCGTGFCELVTHSCVSCIKDSDCPAKAPTCGPSRDCSPKCAADKDCPSGLHCDPSVSLCAECVTNAHCATDEICQPNHTCG